MCPARQLAPAQDVVKSFAHACGLRLVPMTLPEAVWMGVPVLTMKGGPIVSAPVASFSTAAGFADWIAKGDGVYIASAEVFAQDTKVLQPQTAGYYADRYGADFGAALRTMWQKTMQHLAAGE